jgi:hypothetical protein
MVRSTFRSEALACVGQLPGMIDLLGGWRRRYNVIRLVVCGVAGIAAFDRVYFPDSSVDGSIGKISRFSTSSAH